ncbi:hypothetical protein [Halioxenophilus aromaticivorans]|uniref:Uncharacterized protein n=1 Tax=Halioxenophilus aromaticivorans TaxID=1306992 RepID=A0AAV3U1I1_9ALTE
MNIELKVAVIGAVALVLAALIASLGNSEDSQSADIAIHQSSNSQNTIQAQVIEGPITITSNNDKDINGD